MMWLLADVCRRALRNPSHPGTEYAANYRIENGILAMIHTDAGYYTPVTSPGGAGSPSYMHVWYLKDHLGNNRVLADGGGNALAVHDYAPYGDGVSAVTTVSLSPFPSGASGSPYRYGGKEWSVPTSTYDFEARQFSPFFHRFTSMDPLAEKYYSISPYAYCADNPVNLVDPSGSDNYVFDQNGDYLWKDEAEGEHRIAYRTYTTNRDGSTKVSIRFYDFADPVHDPEDIENGLINYLKFLSERDIRDLLSTQEAGKGSVGGFLLNSLGGGDYDYSYSILKDKYGGKIVDQMVISRALYLPVGTDYAHNIMNLGNFLWAITGYMKGWSENSLKWGADKNSRYNSRRNGYDPQPDSADDQLSISEGVKYAKKRFLRVGL